MVCQVYGGGFHFWRIPRVCKVPTRFFQRFGFLRHALSQNSEFSPEVIIEEAFLEVGKGAITRSSFNNSKFYAAGIVIKMN